MTPQERDVLLPLLDRLRQTRVANKDAEADQLIRQTVQAQPDAPYILAQTVLMQDYALHAAQDRIQALEQQLAQHQQEAPHSSGGGFLGGLLGGLRPSAPPPPPGYGQAGSWAGGAQGGLQGGAPYPRPSYGAQIASAVQPGAGQPSFLRGAAQTAAGIAGGALLFQGLEGLFGGHGGFGGGLLGGGSGLLGGAAGGSGFASVDQFVDHAGAHDYQPLADDQGGLQGGDYADQSDVADVGGSDFGGGDLGSDDFGGDDSFNS